MNIKEFRLLPERTREKEVIDNGVFIEVYKDLYNDVKSKYLKDKILLYRLHSFYVYCYKTKLGGLSIISIQGVIDYLEPKNLNKWLLN
jgi:hypothetical protein